MAPGSRSRTPSLRRQSQPVTPLPMIIEDATDPPVLPERSARRTRPASTPVMPSQYGSLSRNNSTGSTTTGKERPPYSSVGGPTPDHLKSEAARPLDLETQGIRDRMARRGGWYKLVLVSILVVGIVIGLAVGLTVGLRKRNDPRPPPPLPTDLFPAGSYAFTTALINITTDCLPRTVPTDTWTCPPGNLYNSSTPDLSATTYHWIIEPASRSEYVISSPPLPIANNQPAFTNLSLTLVDINEATERLTFSFTTSKSVPVNITAPDIDTKNTTSQITCFFNETTMIATIWTRMRATYPVNITHLPTLTNASSRTSFDPWPFKVEVREEQNKVGVMPECRYGDGRSVPVPGLMGERGVRRQEIAEDEGGCSCLYANYGLVDSDDGGLTKNVTRGVGRRRIVELPAGLQHRENGEIDGFRDKEPLNGVRYTI